MELKQRRYSLLVVSSQPKFNESLKALISERQRYEYGFVTSVSGAKQRLNERSCDIVMINAPLPDDDGVRLAIDCSSGRSCVVLLLVAGDHYDEIFEVVCPYGVYMLPKPFSRQYVMQAFDWLESASERLSRLEKKTLSVEDKLTEIRLVNRAKWILITSRGMTEEEAHHYIEKSAMDNGVTKSVIAQQILNSE